MNRFAISDIHGCCKTFRYLVEEVLQLTKDDELYLLGDYIDRGPDSKGVLDFIMELRSEGYTVFALYGNHEDMLLDAKANPGSSSFWINNGGAATLESFNVGALQQIPEKYFEFIRELDFYIDVGPFLLVHAGFNFSAPDPFEDTESMIWIRHFEVDLASLGGRGIIHGHTPIPLQQISELIATRGTKVINIDGGCVFKDELGYLTALNMDTLQLHTVQNRE